MENIQKHITDFENKIAEEKKIFIEYMKYLGYNVDVKVVTHVKEKVH